MTAEEEGRDFPGGPVVKNLPSNAGDTGLIPGQGTKVPHATGQLSLWVATAEPEGSGAHTPQLERSLHATTETWCNQINKGLKKKKKEEGSLETHRHTGRKAMSCGAERSKLCSCTQGRPRAAASEKLREKHGTDSPSEPPGGTHPASTLPPELWDVFVILSL